MENIAKDIFNKDLDDYIKRTRNNTRGKKGFDLKFSFSNNSNKPKVKPYHDEDSSTGVFNMFSKKPAKKDEDLTLMKKKIEATGEEIEELKEEEEVLEEKREGMISRFFGKLFGTSEKELPDQVQVVDLPKEEVAPKPAPIDSSVIEVMKISAKWLNKLDPELKEEFRNSQDYAKYKFLVEKINSKR